MSDAQAAPRSTDTPTREAFRKLNVADRDLWRVTVPDDNPDADARNLQQEFPMGWFTVCYGHELAIGDVMSVGYFGKELAVWRGEDGAARVLNAHCPHYGANMATGGKVHGNLLECPFHAWRWDEAGMCREIPYSLKIPPQAKREERDGHGLVSPGPHRAALGTGQLFPSRRPRLDAAPDLRMEDRQLDGESVG